MSIDPNLLATLQGKATTPAPAAVVPTLAGADVIAASKALAADVHVTGMLRPFQPHQGAAYLYCQGSVARWGGALLGDDMGLGKTQVMLALAADAVRTTGLPALIIAPPVTVAGYKGDLAAAFPSLSMFHAKGRKPEAIPAGTDIVFMSDDPLTLRAWLTLGVDDRKRFILSPLTRSISILCRDELHRDKGADGKPGTPTSRARLMLTLADALRASRTPIIGATGTVLTNRPIEALLPLQIIGGMPLVKAITPGARNAMGFAFYFCNPVHNGFGYSYGGCQTDRMPELHNNMRRTVYCRREKSDLGTALPHSGWIVKPIALNGVLTRYKRIEREFLDLVREEEGPEAMWRKARAEALTRMQSLWEEAGAAKAAAAVEYVSDLVDQGRPVVLFYYHKAARDALASGLYKAKIRTALIDGSVTGPKREQVIEDFQAGRVTVLLAQVKAAGVGVTLTRAADAVFVQVPWSAGDLKQAADRILRTDAISRQRAIDGGTVTWHVLQAAKDNGDPTFDMAMWDVLERKAMVCDAVNAGRPITMPDESVMKAALTSWFAQQTP